MTQKNFSFDTQFATAEEYNKALFILRKLDEKTGISGFYTGPNDLESCVRFCNYHNLRITGVQVNQYQHSGGEKLSDKQLAALLKECYNIDTDGAIYQYFVLDSNRDFAPAIYCLSSKNNTNCITYTDKDFQRLMADINLDFYLSTVYNEEAEGKHQKSPGKLKGHLMEAEGNGMHLSLSRVMVKTREKLTRKNIDFIISPQYPASNQWILNNEKLKSYDSKKLDLSPVIRIDKKLIASLVGSDIKKLKQFSDFEVPMSLFPEFYNEEQTAYSICLSCKDNNLMGNDIAWCKECADDNLVLQNDDGSLSDQYVGEGKIFSKVFREKGE